MKKMILSLLIIGILLLSACTKEDTQAGKKAAFLGGNAGIVATFEQFGVEENGVSSVFDTETFPIEVTLANKGEYILQPNDVQVELLGPSRDELTGIASWKLPNSIAIEPISELLPAGGQETITFARDAKFTRAVKGAIDRTWYANIDYHYQTYVIIPEACLKENLNDKRVCDVVGAKGYSVSGAPVTITGVEENSAGKGIVALKLKVKNVAGGKVTSAQEDFGVQEKLAYSIDDPAWECKQGGKENEARLVNGEAEIVCKLRTALPTGTLATKQLKVTFDYKYRSIVQKALRIKESAR